MNKATCNSEHTGKELGFSWSSCDRCNSKLGGDRFEWFTLHTAKIGQRAEEEGEVCGDCLMEIEG